MHKRKTKLTFQCMGEHMNAQDWQGHADHLQALALQSNSLPGFDTWADFWKACDSAALAAARDGAHYAAEHIR